MLDGNSHDGSLRELDTDFEESSVHTGESAAHDSVASSRKDGKKKKSKRKSMVGRAHEAAAAAEELESEQESVASPRKKRTTSSRRYKASEDLDDDINNDGYPAEYDEVVPLADEPAASSASSPKKRKAGDQTTPRTSSILKVRCFSMILVLPAHLELVWIPTRAEETRNDPVRRGGRIQ